MFDNPPLDKKLLRETLDIALESGGDFAEIFIERGHHSSINLEEDIVKDTAESVDIGLSVRVLSGVKTGFGYTNDLSPERIRQTAVRPRPSLPAAGNRTRSGGCP